MEKIKFGSVQYDLVPDGTRYGTGEQLHVVLVWPDGATYEDIEASVTGCDRIEILSDTGELLEAIKGYSHVHQLRKQFNYVIAMEQVQDGTNEAGEPLYVNQDVTGTVMIVTLKQTDIRDAVESLQAAVDMLVFDALV